MVAHGKIKCTWQDNLLRLDVFGPFNVIGVNKAFDELRHIAQQAKQETWFRIDIIDEETLSCPQVMKTIGQSYVWSLNNHCQMIAIVCANRVQLSLLYSFIETSGLNVKAFTDTDEALAAIAKLKPDNAAHTQEQHQIS